MVINGPVPHPDSGFSSLIEIKHGVLTVNPWVDATWSARVRSEADGSLVADDGMRPFRIVPHKHCTTVDRYFKNRIAGAMEDLQLPTDYYGGRMAFPEHAPHELIVGRRGNGIVVMWDGVTIAVPNMLPMSSTATHEVWMYVDKSITLEDVVPWMVELHTLGYVLCYTTIEAGEYDEQVHIMRRDLVMSHRNEAAAVLDYCTGCESHTDQPILIEAVLEYIAPDLRIFQGDTNDAFQTRNAIERFIGTGRAQRLNSRISIRLPGTMPFHDYQGLIEEVHYARYSGATITYYRNSEDADQPAILRQQENYETGDLLKAFPLRLREIITTGNTSP